MANHHQFDAFQLPFVLEWTIIRPDSTTHTASSSRGESQQTNSVPASPNNTSNDVEMNSDENTSRTLHNDNFSISPSMSRSSSVPSLNSLDNQNNHPSAASSDSTPPLRTAENRPTMTSFAIYIPSGSNSPSFNIFSGSSDTESSHESTSDSQSNVHTGFVCNHCDQSPIVGTRYHCRTCIDWDLCSNCYRLEREAAANGATATEEFLRTAAAPESSHIMSHEYREITVPVPSRSRNSSNAYLPMFFRSLLLSALTSSFGTSVGVDSDHFEQFLAEMMNTQPNGQFGAPPATESAITALNHFKVEKSHLESGLTSDGNIKTHSNTRIDICAICQEDFVEGDEAMGMPCSHVFHEACLKPWLTQHCTCPNCRTKIANVDDDKLPKETEDIHHNSHNNDDHNDNNQNRTTDMDWSFSSD